MVHSPGSLLAAGTSCVSLVSDRLVANAAVSDCWHRRQRRVSLAERNSVFAGAIASRAADDLKGTSYRAVLTLKLSGSNLAFFAMKIELS